MAVVLFSCLLLLSYSVTSQTFEIGTVVGHRFYAGEGGLASHVAFHSPFDVAIHPITDDLFIADLNNHVIRKIERASGVITAVAGTLGEWGFSGDGGPATRAKLYSPKSIAFSVDGQSMYIADLGNNRVRMVRNGIITTVAGTGVQGYGGDLMLATAARLNQPSGVTVLPTGELVIADTNNHRIRMVSTPGYISTIAGTGCSRFFQ